MAPSPVKNVVLHVVPFYIPINRPAPQAVPVAKE